MAQKVSVQLVDDLDGTEATETVTFSLDGNTLEIDLSQANAAKLRRTLGPFVANARKGTLSPKKRRRTGAGRAQSTQMREWAKTHGYKVNERGRIPQNIVAEYETAHA